MLPLPATGEVRVTQGTPPPPPSPPRPGYVTPEEQAQRDAQDKENDTGIPVGSHRMEHRAAEEAAANAPISGGFAMDPDLLKRVQAEWVDIAHELNVAREEAILLAQTRPPADEDASNLQIRAAYAHAVLYAQKLQEQFEYADAYATALQQAIDKSKAQDEAAAEAARRAGKG